MQSQGIWLLAGIVGMIGCGTTGGTGAIGQMAKASDNAGGRPTAATRDLTYFAERLFDLDGLAVLEDGIRCMQASSYDRASRYDEATGEYVKWDANGDSGHYIRTDARTGEAVMAEIDGPGCIWRIWSANPQGKIRFYFDGAETPGCEFDFNELFSGRVPGFPRPLVWQRRVVLGGENPASNCYVPIPFGKSCKVTADKPHRQYYHIGYTTYPKDWKIRTFSLERTPEEEAAIARACKAWSECGTDPQPVAGMKTVEKTVAIPAGQRVVLAELDGPATIRQFFAKLHSSERWARRKVLLQMFWDGAAMPAVDAPIGDFFGDAWNEDNYSSLPLGITNDLNYCYWRMPFARSARIVVVNEGRKPAELRFRIAFTAGRPREPFACFHAKWRRDKTSRDFDYPFLECTGRGRFVGAVLFPDNIKGGWWGEGDEKVYVDGEKFPSTFGTGSEDYLGDAWGIRYFVNPYHGCPTPGEFGEVRRQSCYRWHIADNIPFSKSFRITIENYSAIEKAPIPNDYSSMAYWYLAPGGSDFFKPTAVADRIPQGPVHTNGINAEALVPADNMPPGAEIVTDDDLPEQLWEGRGLKVSGKAGTTVSITLPAPDANRFTVEVFTAKGVKASKFELLKDGKPIGEKVRLSKGPNTIGIRLTGDPVDGDRCEVVIDYFVLHPYRNFVQNWYLIGPFDNRNDVGFDRTYGPEAAPFSAGATFDGKNGKVAWQKINVPAGQVVSGGNYFTDNEFIALYGYCEVLSPDDRTVTAYAGSDDGIKVWVNGKVVHANKADRGLVPDADRFEVPLKKGTNAILVKVTQGHGPWGFALRLNDPDDELKYTLPE